MGFLPSMMRDKINCLIRLMIFFVSVMMTRGLFLKQTLVTCLQSKENLLPFSLTYFSKMSFEITILFVRSLARMR